MIRFPKQSDTSQSVFADRHVTSTLSVKTVDERLPVTPGLVDKFPNAMDCVAFCWTFHKHDLPIILNEKPAMAEIGN